MVTVTQKLSTYHKDARARRDQDLWHMDGTHSSFTDTEQFQRLCLTVAITTVTLSSTRLI